MCQLFIVWKVKLRQTRFVIWAKLDTIVDGTSALLISEFIRGVKS